MRPSLPSLAVLGLLLSVLAGSCVSEKRQVVPNVSLPETFSASGDQPLPARWWTHLSDPVLGGLIDSALDDNFSLAAVWERFVAARTVVKREAGERYPEIDAFAESGLTAPRIGDDEGVTLGLAARYELDLWGRVRSGVAAEAYRAEAEHADYRAAAISLSAEIAIVYYQLVSARQQQALLDTQIETNEAVLSLIKTRLGTEQIRMVDVLRQRQLVEATRAQRIASEADIAVLAHRLAVLLGKPPTTALALGEGGFPDLPPLPDTGLPGDLVKRRPDVRRAYYHIQAADRDVAVAVANRFPRLRLTANTAVMLGGGGAVVRDWVASLIADLLAPLFRGGALKAEKARTEAVLREQINAYGQTVLDALREVEDALVREANQASRIESIEKQIALVTQTQDQLRLEFMNGFGDYLDILLALTSEQQLGRDLIAARRDLIAYRIALYRALAGGFDTERDNGSAEKRVDD